MGGAPTPRPHQLLILRHMFFVGVNLVGCCDVKLSLNLNLTFFLLVIHGSSSENCQFVLVAYFAIGLFTLICGNMEITKKLKFNYHMI